MVVLNPGNVLSRGDIMHTLKQNNFRKYITITLLMFLLASVLVMSGGCSLGADRLYRDGEKLMQEGRFDEASTHFSEYIKRKPKDPRGYVALSDVLLIQASMTKKSFDYATMQDKSFALLQKAKEVAPESEIPHIGLGRFYMSSRQLERAKQEFYEARDKNPKNPEHKHMLAIIYTGEGNIKEAEKLFKEIINTCSKNNEDHRKSLLVAYTGLLEFIGMETRTDDESLKLINEAINFKPDYSRAYAVRGIASYKIGKINDAIEDFNKALELCEESEAFAHKLLGKIYEKKGDTGKAINHYKAFLNILDNDPQTGIPQGKDQITERDVSIFKAYTGIDPEHRDLKSVRDKIKKLSAED
jgi:tetratricopeptide (TPR) repeat protein